MAIHSAVKTREAPRRAPKAADPEASFLIEVGERVRSGRARSGITRRALAQESGVSERYLAHLEAGKGNISILLLQKVAAALGLPVAELLAERDEQMVEVKLIHEFLRRLPPQQLPAVRQHLVREFGNRSLERLNRVALIGLRGGGKSTLGALLAKDLGVPFVELDREIEREAGTSLSEIFLLYGQQGYRRYERRCLEKLIAQRGRCVIATGGSIVSEPGTYDLLLSACFTVWLKAAPEEHMARVIAQGDTRPMAGNLEAMDDLRRILDGRAALYAQADATVDTAGRSVERSMKDLKKAMRG